GGIDMIASDTISFVKNDIKIFGFAVLIFIIFVLFLIYRDIKWVIIPLISTVYSVLFMTGFVGFMEWEITAISSNFISLMLILSISMNIHIVNHYRIHSIDNSIANKLYYTMSKMFWPCLYTGLTTIVAFSSLLFSNIRPIIDFGFIMVFALLFIFLSSFTILPLLISFFPKIKKDKIKRFFILDLFYNISIKNTYIIFLINLIFICFSIYGINKLNVENSFINYFKSNTEIHKGMKLIDTELGGTTPIDIIIEFNEETFENQKNNNIKINEEDLIFEDEIFLEEDLFLENITEELWFTDEKIITVNKIHQYLQSREEIGKVQSIYSLIEMGNLINKKELTNFEISILYKEMPETYKENLIKPFLSIENNMIKINARIKDSYEINRNQLIIEIEKYIKSEFNNIDSFEVNGLLVLYNNMLQSLFDSQLKSFGIILLVIFFMFLILFQSIKLSLYGMIPNIVASTFVLGLMGNLGIPLDIMTITVAAITIGIAVDNTIHYIYRIKENQNSNNIIEESIKNTHNNVGNAVLTTSLTIAFGFSVLILSNFIPTILFGLFTALAMIVAMLGVLLTLPTLITKFKI
ncbi:MMPL family transporter, partial [Alphaproteobacteria bacterium]|nr:MMPL family transporter [Alphaproteobacteria bacterium]